MEDLNTEDELDCEAPVSSLSIAEDKIKEHMTYIDRDIKHNAANNRFEMCNELQAVKRGLQYALDDIQEVKVGVLADNEYVELPPAIFELIKLQAARIVSAEALVNNWVAISKALYTWLDIVKDELPIEVIAKRNDLIIEFELLRAATKNCKPLEWVMSVKNNPDGGNPKFKAIEIRALRKALKCSRAEFAAALGISVPHLDSLQNGRKSANVPVVKLLRILRMGIVAPKNMIQM